MKGTILGLLVLLLLATPAAVQGQFSYSTNADNDITISGYFGGGGAVTIPTNINGLTVTSIAQGPFVGVVPFEFFGPASVTIPESVTNIGDDAFEHSVNLTNVMISGSVTYIGNLAFGTCSDLSSVTIADGVTSIGSEAFFDCTGLTSVTIPGGVTIHPRINNSTC
jgi:hypothetical protein